MTQNMFHLSVERTSLAEWMLSNQRLVKSRIHRVLIDKQMINKVDECFLFCVTDAVKNACKQDFDRGWFGADAYEQYEEAQYALKRVEYQVKTFIRNNSYQWYELGIESSSDREDNKDSSQFTVNENKVSTSVNTAFEDIIERDELSDLISEIQPMLSNILLISPITAWDMFRTTFINSAVTEYAAQRSSELKVKEDLETIASTLGINIQQAKLGYGKLKSYLISMDKDTREAIIRLIGLNMKYQAV
jgi:hypothetical protein